jgi:hypothetical protein
MAHFVIDTEHRLVTVVLGGCVRVQDVANYFSDLRQEPDFDPTYSELADCSNVTDSPITRDDLEYLAARDPFAVDAKRALVLAHDLPFGLGRMYAMMMDRPGLSVVRTHAEAYVWLKLVTR